MLMKMMMMIVDDTLRYFGQVRLLIYIITSEWALEDGVVLKSGTSDN